MQLATTVNVSKAYFRKTQSLDTRLVVLRGLRGTLQPHLAGTAGAISRVEWQPTRWRIWRHAQPRPSGAWTRSRASWQVCRRPINGVIAGRHCPHCRPQAAVTCCEHGRADMYRCYHLLLLTAKFASSYTFDGLCRACSRRWRQPSAAAPSDAAGHQAVAACGQTGADRGAKLLRYASLPSYSAFHMLPRTRTARSVHDTSQLFKQKW